MQQQHFSRKREFRLLENHLDTAVIVLSVASNEFIEPPRPPDRLGIIVKCEDGVSVAVSCYHCRLQ